MLKAGIRGGMLDRLTRATSDKMVRIGAEPKATHV